MCLRVFYVQNIDILLLCKFQFALHMRKTLLLLLLGCLVINIHRGADIRMAHNLLNDLQVGFNLT